MTAGMFRFACLLLGAAVVTPAFAHPIHTSLAEADYNRATRALEIGLRVFADDFEAALSARAKRKISLEKTPSADLETLTRAYLAETFTVRDRDGTAIAAHWIGRELKDAANELWLYFEMPLPDGLAGVRIRHAVLGEHFPDQLNTVRVRDAGRSVTLLFFPDRGEKVIPPLR